MTQLVRAFTHMLEWDHFDFSRICSIIWRMAAVEPGARFSRQTSRRLQVSSIPEKR